MRNTLLIKQNEKIAVMPRSIETEKAFRNLKQLCRECDDSCREKCRLIRDVHVLSIDNYDFIKEGIQLIGAADKPISLIVFKCDSFINKNINNKTKVKVLRR